MNDNNHNLVKQATTPRVPPLRFPDFSEPWVEKRLGDVAKIEMGQSPPSATYNQDEVGLPLVQGMADTSKGVLIPKQFTSTPTKVIEAGAILLSVRAPVGEVVTSDIKVCIGRGMAALRSMTDDYQDFIFQWLQLINATWRSLGQGSTFEAISSHDIAGISMPAPHPDEQRKIADFLGAVDRWVAALRARRDALATYKSGVMQQIFSQKIRFTQPDGTPFPDWQEKRLGDVVRMFSGGTPLSSNRKFFDGQIPFIRSGEISNSSTELCINETALQESAAKLVNEGDILYAIYGATSGEVALSRLSGAINQAILCIRFEGITGFLFQWLIHEKHRITSQFLQGGQGNLSADIIKSLVIKIPHPDEQRKIADFLGAIDRRIDAATRQITTATTFKHALLQQMFI